MKMRYVFFNDLVPLQEYQQKTRKRFIRESLCKRSSQLSFLTFFILLGLFYIIPFHCSAQNSQKSTFTRIHTLIQRLTQKGAKVGCQIMDSETGEVIWAYHPNDPLIPASNMKLLTTAVSLIRLGSDYQFKTRIYVSNQPVDGVVEGDLFLKGFGDPFLVNEEMWMLTHELAMRGLVKIKGDLIADDTYFDSIRSPEGWDEDRPPYWYNAEISALSFNFNTVTIYMQPGSSIGQKAIARIDPELPCLKLSNEAISIKPGQKRQISIHRIYSEGENWFKVQGHIPLDSDTKKIYRTIKNPTIYTAMAFKDFLKAQGIEVQGMAKKGETPEEAIPFYTHESKPLSRIMADLNKISNNFIAEQIVKTMAADIEGPPGTHEKGIEIIKETLQKMGIDLEGLKMLDGSGLSSLNRVPVRIISNVLFYMAHSKHYGPEFISSLAISGKDGTLKDRPINSRTNGLVRAKTGRIKGVCALSGYLWTTKGKPLIFSILMNGKNSQIEEFMNTQDRILSILSTLQDNPKH